MIALETKIFHVLLWPYSPHLHSEGKNSSLKKTENKWRSPWISLLLIKSEGISLDHFIQHSLGCSELKGRKLLKFILSSLRYLQNRYLYLNELSGERSFHLGDDI